MHEQGQSSRLIEIHGPDGVVLRELTVDDAQRYFDLVDFDRDHLSQHGEPTAQNYSSLEKARERLANPGEKQRFGIWVNGEMVGSINLTPQEDTAELGYWIGKQHVGHGYAAKATQALVKHAFAVEPWNYIFAIVDKDNQASVRTLENAGFIPAESRPALEQKRMFITTKSRSQREGS
ncbi:MAG TPA: GNAT family N-acetyltransferase [Candidatus Saccharimonadales bacterium]|nr:GNAT family N-acetyltransferase [Candidatus Saccharimonadales bacterium]